MLKLLLLTADQQIRIQQIFGFKKRGNTYLCILVSVVFVQVFGDKRLFSDNRETCDKGVQQQS